MLDTNVVSEAMRKSPNELVWAFFDRSLAQGLVITTVTLFEIRFGIGILRRSAECERLETLLERFVRGDWGKVLPLDSESANQAARFRAARQKAGRPVGVPDSLIAGIALRHGAAFATRNVRDFEDSGLELVDPWQAST
ncbi:type II toxin-antitoxin system VapC family toxin [Aureimonas leprariae]|uniref:type II toxin-antitoxin system VapC family toxin n=1 Tax=Plantimonas leprariae TaxID=2615207 RepID=UPI001AED8DC8|nr:type II toxin-antitoxin system VapC family toxin [Aureimonas leprariae]